MRLLGRDIHIVREQGPPAARDIGLPFQSWVDQVTSMMFNGTQYLVSNKTTLGGQGEEIESNFQGYVNGILKRNGPVFACASCRALLFSEARFQFRRRRSGRPGALFGGNELARLETPWPGGTTGDLLSRMELDVQIAGNSYTALLGGQLKRLRPDWTQIVFGSFEDEDVAPYDLNAELLGYVYTPGGPGSGRDPVGLLREEVAHYAPIPDPLAYHRGMSWMTPVIREIQADGAATDHKSQFFENGATPNLFVKLELSDIDAFEEWVGKFRDKYEGVENAYRTLFLGAGADATVVGASMEQADFKTVQGHGETRIAAASGMAPIIVGLSEGLESATYSNYGQAKRRVADGTLRPLWRNAAASLSNLITVPDDAELWYDDRDIPFLQEDVKDAAEVLEIQARTLKALTEAGYTKDSAQAAVLAGDYSLLQDSGMTSVQLFPPGKHPPAANGNGAGADSAAPVGNT